MDNKIEIEAFFKSIRKYLKQNNGFEFEKSHINSILRMYGIVEDIHMEAQITNKVYEICESIQNMGSNNLFKEQGNSPKKFFHLVFNGKKNIDYKKVTKLFIPIKYDKTPEVIEQIYYYLVQNNISCETKVATNDRSDNFVVRLYNIEDVDPFIEYCNQNNIIKDNLKKTNPFVCRKNNIGVTQDDAIKDSFNSTLAHSLTEYINACSKFDELNEMSAQSFIDFVIELLNEEPDEDLKFDYLCVINSVNSIIQELDPVSVIKDNIKEGYYNL